MKTIFDGENTITYSEWDLLKEPIMKQTPTEVKAEAKARELEEFFKNLNHPQARILINYVVASVKVCDENIATLSSMKGMGRIHKLTFWKLVRKNLVDD